MAPPEPDEPGGDRPDPAAVLARGELVVRGRMPWSSNGTFLVSAGLDGVELLAVYKPERGERPLWDFPPGLHRREVAAYELSEALGWHLVPLTLGRDDGPMGEGSLQLLVEADFEQHYFTLFEDEANHPALRRLCLFDVLANSADRKGGHCLVDADGRLWAIDNGLCLHAESKLRTVIWDFGGEPVPDDLLADVEALLGRGFPEAVTRALDPFERDALGARARAVLAEGRFPVDPTGRRYPWPLV
jgi:uncharacterized repeat protein (TIGR03843 family)